MRSRGWVVWGACLLALAGCAGEPAVPPTPQPSIDPMGALEALPDCPSPPAALPDEVEGLVLPEGSVVTSIQAQDPLTTVQAVVPFTPAQFEADYADRAGIDVLITENEIYEAELLISDGSHRNFLKATATCSTGSAVMAVVAPEVDAAGLPLPQGAATASPAPSP